MQQILQSLSNGVTAVADVPTPAAVPGTSLIRTSRTLISAGTERMLLEFGRSGWIDRARQQPDKVRLVLDKVRTDGVMATLDSVRAKLDQPVALGYSNAGVCMHTGERMVSNGPHAEMVRVPKNLCARIPGAVDDDAAAFTVVGAIALQGIRLAQPTLGETFVVTGLGLIGLMTVQLLRAQGCRVIGIDPDPRRLELGAQFGAEPLTAGAIVDGVLITASSRSSDPVHQAAGLCRKRGRIVLVGVTGLELSRDDFYKKELSFQVSCSYGPGRYDPAYEEGGQDYPLPYVRWTAQRNFEAVLELMGQGKINVAPLITHRFPFEQAEDAYKLLLSGEPHLGILLDYPAIPRADLHSRTISIHTPRIPRQKPVVGLIGAGQHALRMLLPAIRESGATLATVADSNGVAAAHAARKFGFESATTDITAVLADPAVDTVFVATRHNSHARLVCEAFRAGKNVYVEKPLAIRAGEIEDIRDASLGSRGILMVGFNRRFAPHIVRIKQLLKDSPDPKALIMTVNAGAVPAGHWTLDPEIGGGRIIGEACHFIDLLRFLVDTSIVSTAVSRLDGESVTITLAFACGSTGAIHYLANGHKSFAKERLELFTAGKILQLDNFRTLRGYGWPWFRKLKLWSQDKGHAQAVHAFLNAVRKGEASPIPLEQAIEVTSASLTAAKTC